MFTGERVCVDGTLSGGGLVRALAEGDVKTLRQPADEIPVLVRNLPGQRVGVCGPAILLRLGEDDGYTVGAALQGFVDPGQLDVELLGRVSGGSKYAQAPGL
jgi:hypothetical protein